MPTFREMDQQVTLSAQMGEMSGPVILINTLSVSADEIVPLLRAWTADASWMKRQPGFISAQLHRGVKAMRGGEPASSSMRRPRQFNAN